MDLSALVCGPNGLHLQNFDHRCTVLAVPLLDPPILSSSCQTMVVKSCDLSWILHPIQSRGLLHAIEGNDRCLNTVSRQEHCSFYKSSPIPDGSDVCSFGGLHVPILRPFMEYVDLFLNDGYPYESVNSDSLLLIVHQASPPDPSSWPEKQIIFDKVHCQLLLPNTDPSRW